MFHTRVVSEVKIERDLRLFFFFCVHHHNRITSARLEGEKYLRYSLSYRERGSSASRLACTGKVHLNIQTNTEVMAQPSLCSPLKYWLASPEPLSVVWMNVNFRTSLGLHLANNEPQHTDLEFT